LRINKNEDFDVEKTVEYPDGFLYFEFIIDCESTDFNKENFVEAISELLLSLWSKKVTAVAACDFEEILPLKGGYKSKNIYWPSSNN
jgi:hypothetical protein